MTRFGLYKIVRRHPRELRDREHAAQRPTISPHHMRHSTAVHLLEAGVEVNVIRDWLGHASLATTNRYAEITIAMKEKALEAREPPECSGCATPEGASWRNDRELLKWLQSL